MNKIKIDNIFTHWILDKFSFFRFISPNAITVSGIFVNFFIYESILHDYRVTTFFLLTYRYLADCLDGGVARKYNKSSKIGGLLDTISDNLLIFIITLALCTIYQTGNEILYALILTFINIFEMVRRRSIVDHINIKVGGNYIEEIYSFFVNNSFIMFIAVYIIYIFNY